MPKPDFNSADRRLPAHPGAEIGADIYCDSALIVRELDRRFRNNRSIQQATQGWPMPSAMG